MMLFPPMFLLAACASQTNATSPTTRTAWIVPMPREPAWQDLALLACVPAAQRSNDAKPVVLSVDESGTLPPESVDFLRRFGPDRVVQVGGEAAISPSDTARLQRLEASDADGAASAIALQAFGKSARVVACPSDEYSNALCASVLAARLGVPLVFSEASSFSPAGAETLRALGATSILLVGGGARFAPPEGSHAAIERLKNGADVARWMQRHGLAVAYLAATNPRDREAGSSRKTSLASALLAAGRQGAVVPVDLPIDPSTGPPSASEANLARVAVVKRALSDTHAAIGAAPEYLCLVAMPDSLPMAPVESKDGIDAPSVSDLEYGQLDQDPFVESAIGRLVAEDGAAALLLASRGLAYERLVDAPWSSRFAMAEWEGQYGDLFANAGFEAAPHLDLGATIGADSPLTNVAAIVHASHASWLQLGTTYAWDSRVLLAPCVVESAGCSTASLDQDPEHRSVAARFLRNGAVAFVGNVRRTIAQYELYRSEFWSSALSGESLGRANRRGLNALLVASLDEGEQDTGPHRYELFNAAFYGDPALVLHRPANPRSRAAHAELHGSDLVVHAPAAWWKSSVFAPEDWKRDPAATITTFRGFGVDADTRWDGEHKRNLETPYFVVKFTMRQRVSRIVPVGAPPKPLGWTGHFFVDDHGDGTRSIFLRVRLVDFDMDAGRLLNAVDTLHFRVETSP
jgi:hypothetical protein